MLDIINFDSSDEHFSLLVSLQDVLWPYPWKNWESVEMCRYDAALIPLKCKAQLDFIRHGGQGIGWGATHETHPATVVGALHEGERAANKVHSVNGVPNNPPSLL